MGSDNHRGDRRAGDVEALAAEISAGGSEGWITTKVAASALGVAPRTVRDYVDRGELVGRPEGEGVGRRLLVSIESVQQLRLKRSGGRPAGRARAEARDVEDLAGLIAESRSPGANAGGGSAATPAARSADDGEILREMLLRLEARSAEAGDLRARLELTAQAESTVRDALDRERARADRLEAQLEEERRRSWWRRLLGR